MSGLTDTKEHYKADSEFWKEKYRRSILDLLDYIEQAHDLKAERDAAILKAEKLEQQIEELRRAQTSQTNQD